jgi:hypothetical protein
VGLNFLKVSSATSAKETAADRATGQSSGRPRHTPTLTGGDSFALSGHSNPPDPDFNAFRKDLADVALAGSVIASHYAEPLDRVIVAATDLRREPSDGAETVRDLSPGEPFAMLDDTLGWAWGYAGDDRRVGYVRSEAVGPA